MRPTTPSVLPRCLKALPDRAPPSKSSPDLRLEGLVHISEIVGEWLDGARLRILRSSNAEPRTLQCAEKTVVLLKGYPRLSETFIAQELLGLERAGLDLVLVSMRRPTDSKQHPVHDEINAPVVYLPEYLHEEPWRVAEGVAGRLLRPGFWRASRAIPSRSDARLHPQSLSPLWTSAGAGARVATAVRMASCAFHPHASLRRSLCQPDHRHSVDLLGARQGHLDLTGLGASGAS